MDPKPTSFKVLMFPWLAHGHIFPFLELAKKLSHQNFHIYFCSTSVNLDSVRKHLKRHSSDVVPRIELVELHLPSLPQLPPNYHTTKNIPPHLMPTLMQAFQMSSSDFSNIIADTKPDLLVYDVFQPWSAKIASSLNTPCVFFAASGSTALSFFHHHHTHKSFDTYPYPSIFIREYEKRDLIAQGGSIKVEDVDEGFLFGIVDMSRDIVLIKSCRGIEGKYMDYLSSLCHRRIVPTGPLITRADEDQETRADSKNITDWLSKKDPFSTLLISFGSENYLSDEQTRTLAKGLEQTDANFIWVIRSPIGGEIVSIEEKMHLGFVEGVKGRDRGVFLQGWAPQAEILSHPSVGGFMSHCGWSSVTESIYFGIPILGAPLKLDQPVNCRMVVEAGVGVEVERGENGEFDGERVAKAINEVMSGETGEGFRFRVRELSKKMRMEEDDGFCEVVEELTRICAEKING